MSDSDRKALTAQIASEEARLSELEAEQAAARQRLDALRAQLKPLHLTTATAAPAPQTNVEKVVLFRSLFRGRTDVFPRYWQNAKKGTVGYALRAPTSGSAAFARNLASTSGRSVDQVRYRWFAGTDHYTEADGGSARMPSCERRGHRVRTTEPRCQVGWSVWSQLIPASQRGRLCPK